RDLAALTLENQSLRSKLGMKGFEDVKKIIFQSPEGQTRSRRSSQGSVPSVPSRNRWMESEESEKPAKSISAHGRKLSFSGGHGRGKNPNDKIGHNGSWQVFMAWVPSGAALLQAESYRPNEKSQKVLMSRKKQSPCGDFASVMPHDGKVAVARDGEDSESGSSSGSSKADRKEEYTLLPLWEASDRLQKKLRKNSRSEAASSACYEEYEPDFGTLEPPWYVLNPDTGLRVYWDILSLGMITYDIIFVPLEVCFTLEETGGLALMDWFTRLFWTFDMGMSCITGFVFADGVIEYRPAAILQRYVKSWFLPDLGMVLSDWIGYLVAGSGLGLGQLARAIRMARA
ncbi:unnamed protein product, partial [Effrenium voratum]